MTDARDPLATPHPPGSIGWVKHLTRHMTGQAVDTMSAPGGRGRQSARLTLNDGSTVIATRRSSPERTAAEAALLTTLSHAGAPVPRVIGCLSGLLLQSDVGRNRLSHAFSQSGSPEEQRTLAAAAMDGLEACRAAFDATPEADRPKLAGIGQGLRWAEAYVARPVFLSGDLGIAPPEIDADALADALAHPPERLTRWNARTGRAAVQPDGSVMWHGWDLAGLRGGVEDLAFLVADEWWPLDPTATEAVLLERVSRTRHRFALRVAILIAANRMADRAERLRAQGMDTDEDGGRQARRLDLPATAPSVVTPHADRLADIAAQDPLTYGFSAWFRASAKRLAELSAPV
ncbi:MAG: hypothetical protein AAGE03_04730 [Pseudomonadota bacterium]